MYCKQCMPYCIQYLLYYIYQCISTKQWGSVEAEWRKRYHRYYKTTWGWVSVIRYVDDIWYFLNVDDLHDIYLMVIGCRFRNDRSFENCYSPITMHLKLIFIVNCYQSIFDNSVVIVLLYIFINIKTSLTRYHSKYANATILG